MAREAELAAALRKADAAGDTEGARRLANAIRRERETVAAPPATPRPAAPSVSTEAQPYVNAGMIRPSAPGPKVSANMTPETLRRPMPQLQPQRGSVFPPMLELLNDPLAPAGTMRLSKPLPRAPEGYSGGITRKGAPPGVRSPSAPLMLAMDQQGRARLDQEAQGRAQAEADALAKPRWNDALYNWDRDVATPYLQQQSQSLIQNVDPENNVSKFISENVTPYAQRAGSQLGAMAGTPLGLQGAGEEMGGEIGGGLSDWAATATRDPLTATAQANEVLNPAVFASKGMNDYGSAIAEAFGGNWNEVTRHMNEGNLNAAYAAMGFSPTRGALATIDNALTGTGGPSIASQIFKPGPTAVDRAADILIKKMKADGLTVEDIRKTANALARRGDSGVYETLSEVAALSGKSSGANLRGLAMALGAVPGEAQAALMAKVAENAEKLPERLSRAGSRATGQEGSKTAATLDELERRLKTESGPLYDAAYASPVDQNIYQTQIAPMLAEDLGQDAARAALRGMRTKLSGLRIKAASPNNIARDRTAFELQRTQQAAGAIEAFLKGEPTTLPVQALDEIKRAFDDQISTSGRYTAGNITSAKRNFADAVSNATGGKYGEALGFYEQGNRLQEAFDIGLNALKQPTWQLERAMKAGNKGSPFSGGEIEAIALGVARHIDDLVEANDQAALTKLTKGKALKNLSTALGDPKAATKFEESIKRLSANREWGRRVAGGSDTAMRQAAIKDASALEEDPITRAIDRVETSSGPPTLFGLAWNATARPLAKAGKGAYRRLRYPGIYDEEVNAALAPLMSRSLTPKPLEELQGAIGARLQPKSGPPLMEGPPKKKGGNSLAARAAVGGLAGGSIGLAGQADAQESPSAQLEAADKRIAELEGYQKTFSTGSPAEIQEALQRMGFDLGPRGVDGRIGPDTAKAIREFKAETEKELQAARSRRKELETQVAYASTAPGAAMRTLRELGPVGGALAGVALGYLSRGSAVKKAARTDAAKAAKFDALLTPGPVGPQRSQVARAALDKRAANINEFWRLGGAGESVPFSTNTKGEWKPRPKPATPSSLYPPKASKFRSGDYGMIAGVLAETGLATVAQQAAQQEIRAAQAEVDRNPTRANLERLENAKTLETIATMAQRAGIGFMGARAASAFKKPYATVRPAINEAEAERKILLEYFSQGKGPGGGPSGRGPGKGPPKPPPTPRAESRGAGEASLSGVERLKRGLPMTQEDALDFRVTLQGHEKMAPDELRKLLQLKDNTPDKVVKEIAAQTYKEARDEFFTRIRSQADASKQQIAAEIKRMRERGVDDRIIARNLGLEDDALDKFAPPPPQKGGNAPPAKPKKK